MVESEYVSIREAARRCGVSDKTIQRAIRAGTLTARYPQSNRCEIAVFELRQFLPRQIAGQSSLQLEQRVVELEHRVHQLENLVDDLLARREVSKPPRMAKARGRTTGPLPKQFVSLQVFAQHHNVAESKVQTHVNMGLLPVKRGEWIDHDGMHVTLAFDAKGRAAFFQIYHDVPPFVECTQCPHQYA